MTQTTQDRIVARMKSVIRCIELGVHSESAIIDGLFEVGVEIAAEIDDLQERNAFLLTSAATAQAKLAEARAEVERRDTYIAELAQKLDRLTAKG